MSKETPAGREPGEREKQIASSLLQESDRGCALIGAAIVNEALEALIRATLRRDSPSVKRAGETLFATMGPLTSFWARIHFCYAQGLIPEKTYNELETIRALRNEFAHTYGPKDFANAGIRDRFDSLIGKAPVPEKGDDELLSLGSMAVRRGDLIGRLAFILHVNGIVGRLNFVRDVLLQGRDARRVVMELEGADRKKTTE